MTPAAFVHILEARGCQPRQAGKDWKARCPAHDDASPSLSISEGAGGRVLVKCFAGCTPDAVVEALGLRLSDLFPDDDTGRQKGAGAVHVQRSRNPDARVVASYVYRNADCEKIARKLRWEPALHGSGKKEFTWQHPDPHGAPEWVSGRGDCQIELYRLPELMGAIGAGRRVYLVEGEKDADSLADVDLDSTSAPDGAQKGANPGSKWLPRFTESLKGAHVVIIADRDETGRAFAQAVAARIHGVAASVRVVEVPDIGDAKPKDATDFLEAGGTAAQLEAIADAAPLWEPGKTTQPDLATGAVAAGPIEGTDAGRARRFVDRFQDVIRFIPEWRRWITFEDGRWSASDSGGIHRLSDTLFREMVAQIPPIEAGGGKQQQAAIKSAVAEASAFATARQVASMATFAASDRRVIVHPGDIDADPWVLGTPRGVVDLRTGEFQPHSPASLVTKSTGVEFDASAECPRWLAFLDRVLPDPDLRRFLWKAAGYSATGSNGEQVFFFLHGRGANGKSTFLEVLTRILGSYTRRASESLLFASGSQAAPEHAVAEVFGTRLLIGSEVHEQARLSEGTVKDLASGDTMRGARKYEGSFDFVCTAKLWIAGNHKPVIRGQDDGIWRRVRLVPFTEQIPPDERIPNLVDVLAPEYPGILNWLIEGCRLWQQEGLKPPAAVADAVAEYRSDEDILAGFLDQEVENFPPSTLLHADLYRRYRRWAEDGGFRPMTSKSLGMRLRDLGYNPTRGGAGAKAWAGIRLRSGDDQDDPDLSFRPTEV